MINLNARIVGPFDATDDFLRASLDTYTQMHDVLRSHDMDARLIPLESALEYLAEVDGPADRILHSFLGRVASDARNILGEDADLTSLPVIVNPPQVVTFDCPADMMHVDDGDSRLLVGTRYLAANCHPTIIPALGPVPPGQIARMPHRRTIHQRPAIYASRELPRVLISADI